MEAERSFQPRPEEIRSVRHFVREVLDGAPVDSAEVALLASEVATNAVVHACTPFTVCVVSGPRAVRVGVLDEGPPLPDPLPRLSRTDLTPGGRGLLLVMAMADRWGVDARPRGKTVWFEVELGTRP